MRLLFDANVSPRLVALLADLHPGSSHVFDVGNISGDDRLIWQHAEAHGFTIVSKDGDFQGLSLVRGAPPKVIWLRVGNAGTPLIAQLLNCSERALLKLKTSTPSSARPS